jgi:hypothetical protein
MNRMDDKVEAAKEQIDRVFGDTSVSRSTTRAALEDISSYVEAMLDTLSADDDE